MEDKGVPLNANITLNLEKGEYHDLIRPVRGSLTQTVSFVGDVVRESFDTSKHIIGISTEIKATHPVVVLLPNHKDRNNPDLHVLDSRKYSNRDSFNRTLKTRFEESLERTDESQEIRLAVCYGEHVIICDGINGVPYIFWTDFIRSEKGQAAPVTRNTPILVVTTGLGRVKAVYRLQRSILASHDLIRMPIRERSPEFVFPRQSVPFVSETRPAKRPPSRLKTISARDAVAMMTDKTVRTRKEQEYHTREYTTDNEIDVITGFTAQDDCILGPDDGLVMEDTIRVTEAVLAHVQHPSRTPPVLTASSIEQEYDAGADPFSRTEGQ